MATLPSRRLRGLVAAENERIASLLLSLDGASVGGLAVATVVAADGPQSSSFSDPGMPQQAISQQVSEVAVTSRASPSVHVTADGNRHKARRQLSRDKRSGRGGGEDQVPGLRRRLQEVQQ